MSGPPQSSPLITAARLFSKTSAKTNAAYLTGRLGQIRVLVMPNRNFIEGDAENGHSHVLMFGEAAPYQPREAPARQTETLPLPPPQRTYQARPDDRGKKRVNGGGRTQLIDDPLPFGPDR